MRTVVTALTLLLTLSAMAATDPALDITDVQMSQEGKDLVIKITSRQGGDFATYMAFLDTDCQSQTGFRPSADPDKGFDMLISGSQLLRHSGTDRNAWKWDNAGSVDRSIDGNVLTLRVNTALLKTRQFDATVWAMSRDWQTRISYAPTEGLLRVAIDPEAATTRPGVEMAPPRPDRHLSARQRVRNAGSYYCYYGSGKLEALSHFDVVILHSPPMEHKEIKVLNDLGVVTIGYLSVGEDDTEPRRGDGTGPGGFASWYFDKDHDGKPDRNAIWHSYYANANDPQWRADRVALAQKLVREKGYDGIFLDTLDTASLYPQSQSGMIQLVADLRQALPEAPIILNQGWSILAQAAPYADGLMLESFTATYDWESRTYMLNYPQSMDYHLRRVQQEIQPVLKKNPLRVMVLDYALPNDTAIVQEAANRAATFGFLFAAAPIYLDEVYELDVTGKPDPKWLHKMTTPQMLSIKLEHPANGFPAGTTIVPSGDFPGYTVRPMVDGITDRSGLHWSKAAWASAEDGQAAWLEIRLPEPRRQGGLTIDFEPSHPSRTFTVAVQEVKDGPWVQLKQVADNVEKSVTIPLPVTVFSAIRIEQPADGGSPDRPNLLWIAQLHLRDN